MLQGSMGPPVGGEAAVAPSQRPPGGGGGDRQAQAHKQYTDLIFIKKLFLPLLDLILILCWICTGDALHNPTKTLRFRRFLTF